MLDVINHCNLIKQIVHYVDIHQQYKEMLVKSYVSFLYQNLDSNRAWLVCWFVYCLGIYLCVRFWVRLSLSSMNN